MDENGNGRNEKLVRVCVFMGRTTNKNGFYEKGTKKSGRKTKEGNKVQDNKILSENCFLVMNV